MTKKAKLRRFGFTLVELSIVLVIIGLIIGGILISKDLIRASEIRGIISESETYITTVNAFKLKYGSFPGDMKDATSIWGTKSDCSDRSELTATCNGNGNIKISPSASTTTAGNEPFLFWQHLANAELISGKLNGVEGVYSQFSSVIGVNTPRSKIQNACWGVLNQNFSSGSDPTTFYIDLGNFLAIGNPISNNWVGDNAILSPIEAYDIDKKVDDGMPATGKFTVRRFANCTTASSGADFTASYNLTNTSIVCHPQFIKIF